MNEVEFGSKEYPLRASSLATLVACPRQWLEDRVKEMDGIREAKKAADTGSAVHKAISHWHNTGNADAALAVMDEHLPEYPAADLSDARLSFRPYCADSRNTIFGSDIICDVEVSFQTQGIYVVGHIDQLRKSHDDRWYVYDVKTGKENGWEYLHQHAYQMAAYVIGARSSLGLDALPGGLICTYGYRTKKGGEDRGVFQEYSDLGLSECEKLIDFAIEELLAVRSKFRPESRFGPHCVYCPLNFFKCIKGD